MWNQNLLDTVEEKYMGQCESPYERNLVRNCNVFYGQDNRGDHYAIGYERLMDYRTGRRPNPFVWIEYSPTHEEIYSISCNAELQGVM